MIWWILVILAGVGAFAATSRMVDSEAEAAGRLQSPGGPEHELLREAWRAWADGRDFEVSASREGAALQFTGGIRGVELRGVLVELIDQAGPMLHLEVDLPESVPETLTVESTTAGELVARQADVEVGAGDLDAEYRFAGRDDRQVERVVDRSGVQMLLRRLAQIDATITWDGRRLQASSRAGLKPMKDGGRLAETMVQLARELDSPESAVGNEARSPTREAPEEWETPE